MNRHVFLEIVVQSTCMVLDLENLDVVLQSFKVYFFNLFCKFSFVQLDQIQVGRDLSQLLVVGFKERHSVLQRVDFAQVCVQLELVRLGRLVELIDWLVGLVDVLYKLIVKVFDLLDEVFGLLPVSRF